MATFAAAFVPAAGELAGVRIGMAIAAKLVRDLLFEITAGMAFFAGNVAMTATQWESGQIMIESTAANDFPACGCVALRAGVPEAAAMRILVARCAIRKRHAGKLHKRGNRLIANLFTRRFFGMTFDARNVFMFASEHELRALMCKFCCWLPTREIMAAFARGAELPAMLIGMAGDTFLRQTQKSFGQPDVGVSSKFLLNIFLLMTISTRRRCVLARQNVSCLTMIEIRFTFFPTDQCKLHAVMLGVACSAELGFIFAAAGIRDRDAGMIAAPGLQALGNGDVALQAFRVAGFLADFVTGKAFCKPFKLIVRPRQWPG